MTQNSMAGLVLLGGLVAAATPVAASTDEAWKQLDAETTKQCAMALIKSHGGTPVSSLMRARIRGVGGTGDQYYGQVFDWTTQSGKESWLCLYDKQTKKVTLGQYETVQ